MLVLLKFIHLLALMAGGASAIAPVILMRSLAKSGHSGPPPKVIALAGRGLALTGLVAIVTLWITGTLLLTTVFAGEDLGPVFGIKLLAATLVLAAVIWLNLAIAKAARTGTPPNPIVRNRMLIASRASLVVAVLCAVIVFN